MACEHIATWGDVSLHARLRDVSETQSHDREGVMLRAASLMVALQSCLSTRIDLSPLGYPTT